VGAGRLVRSAAIIRAFYLALLVGELRTRQAAAAAAPGGLIARALPSRQD
jgi:hypothetical protein